MRHIFDPIIELFPKSERSWEILLWFILSGLMSGRFWIFLLQEGYFHPKMLPDFYTSILFGIITLLIPLLYWLINGSLPIENLRSRIRNKGNINYNIESSKDVHVYTENSYCQTHDSPATAISVLEKNACESSILANSLFRRSGIYLFIGTLIAVVGVLFFSFQGITYTGAPDTASVILILAPRAGILIFIELIAFFFLKQYRSAMDEHRYFEAIKRERQRAFVITLLLQQDNTKISIDKYVDACGFNREHGKLKTGESTEILESKKIASEEIKLVEKILATIRKNS